MVIGMSTFLLSTVILFGQGQASFRFSDSDYEAYNNALYLEDNIGEEIYFGTFPEDFKWSSATSAYQIEGAWNVSGKGESIWDRHVHEGYSKGNGDVACDSYNKYEEDIASLVYLGVDQYRFSIAWTRILPTGFETEPNQAGIDYYNRVIDGLIAAGIEPVVTLYHWDLPQVLQDYGGWDNEPLVVDAFGRYSRVCFENFGDRVKKWITLNEPLTVSLMGYGNGKNAPRINGIGDVVYRVTKSLFLAHAESYHIYDQEFRANQGGKVGISLNTRWAEPRNKSIASDVDAAMREIEFRLGWFANPIYVNGDWPDIMKFKIAEKSSLQGLPESRLPAFSEEEQARIFGTSDFFGLNYYTSGLIFHEDKPIEPPSYEFDKDVGSTKDDSWPESGSSWLRMTPFGIRKLLTYVDSKYGRPRILVTENGISDRNDSVADDHRVRYYKSYINNVLQAIDLDGVNVIGYTAWSLMDNFEWNEAYEENFGLYYVDFEDPERPRTIKDSVNWYKQMIVDNGFFETSTASYENF